MVASTREWIKTLDKPSEQTWELPQYGAEVIQNLADQTEVDKQLKHANEQLSLTNAYPGWGRQQPRGLRCISLWGSNRGR